MQSAGSFVLSLAAMLVLLIVSHRAPPLAPGLPYVWGAFCGYATLLQAVVRAFEYIAGRSRVTPDALLVSAYLALAVAAGVGLLNRRRFGVPAFFCTWLLGWIAYVDWALISEKLGIVLAGCGFLAAWCIPSAFYFRKRWQVLR